MVSIPDLDEWNYSGFLSTFLTKDAYLAKKQLNKTKDKLGSELRVRISVIINFQIKHLYVDVDLSEDLYELSLRDIELRTRENHSIFEWFQMLPVYNKNRTLRYRYFEYKLIPTTAVFEISYIDESKITIWYKKGHLLYENEIRFITRNIEEAKKLLESDALKIRIMLLYMNSFDEIKTGYVNILNPFHLSLEEIEKRIMENSLTIDSFHKITNKDKIIKGSLVYIICENF